MVVLIWNGYFMKTRGLCIKKRLIGPAEPDEETKDQDYAWKWQSWQWLWNFNHNDDEPEQWWNWQWHCLNISICQWRIENICENILLKSVPQRVICSCTAWSVGFTCIKNSTLISKQIFYWFSFWLWCHRTARWLQVLCTTGLLLFAGKHLFFKSGKVPKLFTIHNFWITVLGSSSPAASLTVPVVQS